MQTLVAPCKATHYHKLGQMPRQSQSCCRRLSQAAAPLALALMNVPMSDGD
jgi:hypothetical protein